MSGVTEGQSCLVPLDRPGFLFLLENFRQRREQLLCRIRLREEGFYSGAGRFSGLFVGGQPTGCDDPDLRVKLLQGTNRRRAIHERHHHVSQHDFDLIFMLDVKGYGLRAVTRC